MSQGTPDRFVEIAAQRIRPKKFNLESRAADKWPQDPRELAAKKQVS
jgi:hypothetical protein